MGPRRIAALAFAVVGMAGLVAAPAAQATFHLMSIREVYPGGADNASFVELQMYASGQNLVSGHAVTLYNETGSLIGTFTFSSDVANGANQQTILIGDSGVQAKFGIAPDLTDVNLNIPARGGAVCWAGSIDCMSWGNFSGSTASASGSPADPSGIPSGMALRRSIAPGCQTLLEAADDTNDSATDFFDAAPNPRNNSSAITEAACTGPTATVDSKPANPTSSTSASFTYHSTPTGASFECKLDVAEFASCPVSGMSYPGPLAEGNHTFQVRAKDATEHVGPAASYTWRIDTTPPTVTIDSHPADPSTGTSASFTFHSSETGSAFQCSLTQGAGNDVFSACSSGKTYTNLANGLYTFKVRATDLAGNQGPAAGYSWTVDNTVPPPPPPEEPPPAVSPPPPIAPPPPVTPPETTVTGKPPRRTHDRTPTVRFTASVTGARFECRVDHSPFTACNSPFTTRKLSFGAHLILIRAVAGTAVEATPAGVAFKVVRRPRHRR